MFTDANDADKKERPCGCGGSHEKPEPENQCVAPEPMPWVQCHNCLKWYLVNTISMPMPKTEGSKVEDRPTTLEFEVTYEMTLCLKGKQPGKLLYTTTLVPQEELRIFVSDRHRRTTSDTSRLSTHASFVNTVSNLTQADQSDSSSTDSDNSSSSSTDASVGVALTVSSVLSINTNLDTDFSSSSDTSTSLQHTLDTFHQTLVSASQKVSEDRSTVISSFEERDNVDTTGRTLKNHNHCRSVTYYFRKIVEVYELSAHVSSIRWRIVSGVKPGPSANWQSIKDLNKLPNSAAKKFIESQLAALPRLHDIHKHESCITLSTDGTMVEAELSHCSSCDGEKTLELEAKIEKEKAEARRIYMESELMKLEIDRRRRLLENGYLKGFDVPVVMP